MSSNVAGVSSLPDSSTWVLSTIGVDLVWAVVFLRILALLTCEVGTDLGADTSAVANFDFGDLGADLEDLADNLVSYTQRKGNVLSPAASDCVNVGSADTAGVNGDVNVILLIKLLER